MIPFILSLREVTTAMTSLGCIGDGTAGVAAAEAARIPEDEAGQGRGVDHVAKIWLPLVPPPALPVWLRMSMARGVSVQGNGNAMKNMSVVVSTERILILYRETANHV